MRITEQDKAILNHLVNGLTAKEIAAEVNLSPKAVEKRIERMKGKNNIRTKAELIAKSIKLNLL